MGPGAPHAPQHPHQPRWQSACPKNTPLPAMPEARHLAPPLCIDAILRAQHATAFSIRFACNYVTKGWLNGCHVESAVFTITSFCTGLQWIQHDCSAICMRNCRNGVLLGHEVIDDLPFVAKSSECPPGSGCAKHPTPVIDHHLQHLSNASACNFKYEMPVYWFFTSTLAAVLDAHEAHSCRCYKSQEAYEKQRRLSVPDHLQRCPGRLQQLQRLSQMAACEANLCWGLRSCPGQRSGCLVSGSLRSLAGGLALQISV